MKCVKCGNEVSPDEKICPACGTSFGGDGEDAIRSDEASTKQHKENLPEEKEVAFSSLAALRAYQEKQRQSGDLQSASATEANQPSEEGQKEKKTLKQRLENYWYYHKWATIIGIIVIICLAFSIHEMITNIEPDLEIALIGENMMMDDMENGSRQADGIIRDRNGDGKAEVLCRVMVFTGDGSDDYYMYQRLMADLAAGESRVYFMDRSFVDYLASQEVLMPLEDEVQDAELLQNGITGEDGNVVAVPVTNTALAEQMGIHLPDETYIGVRPITPSEQNEKGIEEKEENALLFFHEFIK